MPELSSREVGRRIRLVRERQGGKQEEMAAKLGVSVATYSRYEAGKQQMGIELLYRIAGILGVSPAELVTPGWESLAEPRSPVDMARELYTAVKRQQEAQEVLGEREKERKQVIMVEVVRSFVTVGANAMTGQKIPFVPQPGEEEHLYVAFVMKGQHMEPRIYEGEMLIVDKTREPTDGRVVAITHNEKPLIRVLRGTYLECLNGGPPLLIDEHTKIEGVVVKVGNWRDL